MSRHALLFVIVVTALLSLVTQTQVGAVAVPIETRAALGANDLVDWGALGARGTLVAHPFNYQSTGGFPVRVTKATTNAFLRLDQCGPNIPADCFANGWAGSFLQGDKLLFTAGPFPGEGPITIEFSRPILGAGVQIQPNHSGSCEYAGRLRAFDEAGNLLVSFSRGGCSSAAADGSARFLGVRDTTPTIKRIEVDPLPVPEFAGFAINQLSLVLPAGIRLMCRPVDPPRGSFGQYVPLIARHCYLLTTDANGHQNTYAAYDINGKLTPRKDESADVRNGHPYIPGGCGVGVLQTDCVNVPILSSQSVATIVNGLEQAISDGSDGRYDNVENNSNVWIQRRLESLDLAVTLPEDVIASEGDLCRLLPYLRDTLASNGVRFVKQVILFWYGFIRCVL